uniref:GIY-YIG endonuclease n=1 Tax=Orbilia brochopaga TaxID=3140254 RepID=A0A481ZLM9_9PEZI|nr:hypothetical protein [Drechslerella brochopaga]QBL02565.1 hypothetical protein [Drechslerella brochopaga]
MDHLKNQNSNIYLQNAIAKYGLNKFSFYVLEFLPDNCSSYDDLLNLEQKYLDLFKDKYNFENFAKKSRAGTYSTEESKMLMSKKKIEFYTEERKKVILEQFSKELFLYDAKTLNLIKKYSKHEEMITELKVSPKTIIKYKDTDQVFRGKYIITSKLIVNPGE